MADFGDRWTQHLRAASRRPRIACPLCSIQIDQTAWERHVDAVHPDEPAGLTAEARNDWIEKAGKDAKVLDTKTTQSPEKWNRRTDAAVPIRATDSAGSMMVGESAAGPSSASTAAPRDKAGDDRDYDRRPLPKGSLWTDDRPTAGPPKPSRPSPATQRPQSSPHRGPTSLLQPEPFTRPISQEQLITEVKAIYAGLVMVESKCIEVDNAQSSQKGEGQKLNNEQWQALITLHKTLLHEHHDFFLASQHPTAAPALKRLPSKYAMPARMWRHGIHSFLELLRHRLPASLEHMLTFIYLAYSMITLLYETVPAFKDTWIECLGDLGRYRMAIEDEDMKDREIWTGVSRDWYTMASDNSPTVGRLYHHLAILSRPNGIQQLFYYAKSVCVPTPFNSAKESAMTLFAPLFSATGSTSRVTQCEASFICCHGVMFSGTHVDQFPRFQLEFENSFDDQLNKIRGKWTEQGYHMGVANTCALLSFGGEDNILARGFRARARGEADSVVLQEGEEPLNPTLERAISLNRATNLIVLRRAGDSGVLAYLHVVLAFFNYVASSPMLLRHIEDAMPWKALAHMLNVLISTEKRSRHETPSFPQPEKGGASPFPEDWGLRGLAWGEFFPKDWFPSDRSKIDDSERLIERPSLQGERKERILWIATRMAETGNSWLVYNKAKSRFGVRKGYERKNEVDGDGDYSDDGASAKE